MKYEYNVKKGDMIMTDVGVAVLMRQTRTKWFYLFKHKMIISYVKVTKYRTKQRKMRVLDLRGEDLSEEQVSEFEKFEKFAKPPFSIAFDSYIDLDTRYFIDRVESLNLDYEIETGSSGTTMFRVFSYD